MIEKMWTQSLRAHKNDTFRKYKRVAAQWLIICRLNKIRIFIMNILLIIYLAYKLKVIGKP